LGKDSRPSVARGILGGSRKEKYSMSTIVFGLLALTSDPTPLDLQPIANVSMKDGFKGPIPNNNFAEFELEAYKEGGIPFKFGKRFAAILDSEKSVAKESDKTLIAEKQDQKGLPAAPSEKNANSAPKRKRIKVGRAFTNLHVIHATQFDGSDGETIGWYVLRYKGGEHHRLPIIYGRHMVDWWATGDGLVRVLQEGEIFWEGENEAIKSVHMDRRKIRLFKSRFENPRPDLEVEAVDFESDSRSCKPFVFAMTVE
jgi:hypothetical protein